MAETNIPPALQLKELFASYPTLKPESPSSWFVWSDRPNIPPKSYIGQICHADMRYTPSGFDYLVTAVPKTDKVSLKYIRMLIHGPFRAFSDLISLVRVKDNYYLQCNELKKWPAAVLYNFCIASRAPIEFPDKLAGWSNLSDEGYPEVLAFLMSQSTGGLPFKHKREFQEHGHQWFDPSSNWKTILAGAPDMTCPDYSKSPGSVSPTNVIWGKSADYEIIMYLDNVKTAEHFGFKFPPKREKINPNKFELNKKLYWDPEAIPEPGIGPGLAAQQINQIFIQNQNAQAVWNNLQAHGIQMAPPEPHVQINPVNPVLPEDDDDFDPWPDFDEDA